MALRLRTSTQLLASEGVVQAAVDGEPWWCRDVIHTFHYVM